MNLTPEQRRELRVLAASGVHPVHLQRRYGIDYNHAILFTGQESRENVLAMRRARVERIKANIAEYPSISYCYPEVSLERAAG